MSEAWTPRFVTEIHKKVWIQGQTTVDCVNVNLKQHGAFPGEIEQGSVIERKWPVQRAFIFSLEIVERANENHWGFIDRKRSRVGAKKGCSLLALPRFVSLQRCRNCQRKRKTSMVRLERKGTNLAKNTFGESMIEIN